MNKLSTVVCIILAAGIVLLSAIVMLVYTTLKGLDDFENDNMI